MSLYVSIYTPDQPPLVAYISSDSVQPFPRTYRIQRRHMEGYSISTCPGIPEI